MLDIKLIRQNPEKIKKACQDKGAKVDIEALLKIDEQRRRIIEKTDNLKSEHNKLSKKVPCLVGQEREEIISRAKELAAEIQKGEKELAGAEKEFNRLILSIPNPALSNVKAGKDETENTVIKKWGEIPKFNFKPKDHLQIGQELDLIDVERAGKVSGSRFSYLKNQAARLEYALVQFVFDFLSRKGFIPVVPPVMIKEKAMRAMGYLERGGEEVYQTAKDDFYLVGTAEQSVGPMHLDEIFEMKDLPRRYVAFSTCFRREAGSHGQDVKGILRAHQFDKVEMFSFCLPEKSADEHKFLLQMEEEMVQALRIPYQVVEMCTGDLGDPAAAKYDIECWLPGQNRYRETHSTSNCTDFQARRLGVRFRNKDGKPEFVHTLNGTAFAIGRILIAILENCQQKDGSVKVPRVLQKISGIKKIQKNGK